VDILNEIFVKEDEYVESVLLASHGMVLQFVSLSIDCQERVFANILGERYEWNDAPNSGPWGSLARQMAKRASLKSPDLLRIDFDSGDYVEIETVESEYESVIFEFLPKNDALVMQIY